MKLSAPIFHLKRRAKDLSRNAGMSLTKAQDRIAIEEGFNNWSLLAREASLQFANEKIFPLLTPGDLVLLGGRPGQGKTLKSLELLVDAVDSGKRGMFFTLEYNKDDVRKLLGRFVEDPTATLDKLEFDNADLICAEYIIDRIKPAPRETVVVVDYLQLLDRNRNTPILNDQP